MAKYVLYLRLMLMCWWNFIKRFLVIIQLFGNVVGQSGFHYDENGYISKKRGVLQ